MKKLLMGFLLGVALYGYGAFAQIQTFYHDRAVGVAPFQNITSLIPIQYGQVRLCSYPAVSSPCTPLATNITDIYGNALTVSGGNFGQLMTDVTGQFSFGCQSGNYVVQVAASSSNVPQLQYNIACPAQQVTNNIGTVGGLNNQTITGTETGTGSYQQLYAYTMPANTLSTTGGIDIYCGVQLSTVAGSVQLNFGGQTVSGTPTNVTNPGPVIIHAHIFNTGALNTQWSNYEFYASLVSNGSVVQIYNIPNNTLSVDTSMNQPITCSVSQSNAGTNSGTGFYVRKVQ